MMSRGFREQFNKFIKTSMAEWLLPYRATMSLDSIREFRVPGLRASSRAIREEVVVELLHSFMVLGLDPVVKKTFWVLKVTPSWAVTCQQFDSTENFISRTELLR